MSKNIHRTFNQIKSDILKCFQRKENWYRKEIIEECLKNFNLSEKELKDHNSSSILIKSKSMIGSVISSMLNNNDLSIDNGKVITLGHDDNLLIRENQVEIFIKDYITKNKTITHKDLLEKALLYFKTAETKSNEDDIAVNNYVSTKIKYLLKTEFIKEIDNNYIINKKHPYENTEIGNCLNECYFLGKPCEHFIEAINIKGGEFLEQFSVGLLSKYYSKNNLQLLKHTVTGGSNDGGLDGIIETIDELGYFERIFIQTKARNKVVVTVKELREFYGAFSIEKGTKGIFVTNSIYHPHALEFISKTNNVVGIDGKKLYELALKYNYGLITKDNKTILDDKIFIQK